MLHYFRYYNTRSIVLACTSSLDVIINTCVTGIGRRSTAESSLYHKNIFLMQKQGQRKHFFGFMVVINVPVLIRKYPAK
jgi:hypothetical protein